MERRGQLENWDMRMLTLRRNLIAQFSFLKFCPGWGYRISVWSGWFYFRKLFTGIWNRRFNECKFCNLLSLKPPQKIFRVARCSVSLLLPDDNEIDQFFLEFLEDGFVLSVGGSQNIGWEFRILKISGMIRVDLEFEFRPITEGEGVSLSADILSFAMCSLTYERYSTLQPYLGGSTK